MTKENWPRLAIWIIPAILSIVALAQLPYGYYQFLRIVICIAAAYLTYGEYQLDDKVTVWAIVFALLAILFNPIIPVHLKRDLWAVFNIICAIIFITHLIATIRKNQLGD
jgi:hypothetical protein